MKLAVHVGAALVASALALPSRAVQLTTVVTNLGGTNWKVDLALVNDTPALIGPTDPAGTISEFTVFFPYASYTGLKSLAAPLAWDPLAIQPDTSPSDGYLDYLINPGSAPLAIGQRASSFTIGFTYAGAGTPGALRYTVVDPDSFATLYAGLTTSVAVPAVPEPGTFGLLALGFGALAWRQRRAGARVQREDALANARSHAHDTHAHAHDAQELA